jgi:hypothetical protein
LIVTPVGSIFNGNVAGLESNKEESLFDMEALPPNLRDFVAVAPEWLGDAERLSRPAIPAAGSMLEMLPSRALSPARVGEGVDLILDI